LALAHWGQAASDDVALSLARGVFQGLYLGGRSDDQRTLRYHIDASSASAPPGTWCHGPAGYLWCLLNAFGDDPQFCEPIDWAVEAFGGAPLVQSPTFCHGLAGQIELCRLLRAVPRHRGFADLRVTRLTNVLRLLAQRRKGLITWSSEDPEVFTPDLWVGFLGPAAALAMSTVPGHEPILSGSWLRRCAEINKSTSSEGGCRIFTSLSELHLCQTMPPRSARIVPSPTRSHS
jgi:hypothetical protein